MICGRNVLCWDLSVLIYREEYTSRRLDCVVFFVCLFDTSKWKVLEKYVRYFSSRDYLLCLNI